MQNYSPVGDLMVVSICLVISVLIYFSYTRQTKSFRLFVWMLVLLVVSSLTDVLFHLMAVSADPLFHSLAYPLRCVFHASLFGIFVLYSEYIGAIVNITDEQKRKYSAISISLFIAIVAADVIMTFSGRGFVIADNTMISRNFPIFTVGYAAYLILVAVMLMHVRDRVYKNVMVCFYGTMAISFMILLVQGLHGQTSFTVATFLYPVIAMLYLIHSNPYDIRNGAVSARAMRDIVHRFYRDGHEFVFMSLSLPAYSDEGNEMPEQIQAVVRQYVSEKFRNAMLFQAKKGHAVMIFRTDQNRDYEKRIAKVLRDFDGEYKRFKLDYKIVIGKSIDEISEKNTYISLIDSILSGMHKNSVHFVDDEDVKNFNRREYILRELDDIAKKKDLDDPRVLAYCQPVYDITSDKYDTAEALMRLWLKEVGLIYPEEFIPIAESSGYIHVLTEIILHKACKEIARLVKDGYEVMRISVNVSALELNDDAFCNDIIRIINTVDIPEDKIAIELTESQNEEDFILMRDKITELKKHGIKFYLDDFGTGYSNMERILELPFDIIKFDRSLVLASDSSEKSREIVSSIAELFNKMHYSVLYEGVEEDAEERMCREMKAEFLQGYKYSRPVPIETLDHYFTKK